MKRKDRGARRILKGGEVDGIILPIMLDLYADPSVADNSKKNLAVYGK